MEKGRYRSNSRTKASRASCMEGPIITMEASHAATDGATSRLLFTSHVGDYTCSSSDSSDAEDFFHQSCTSFTSFSAVSFTIFIQQSSHLQSGKGRENSSAANVVQPGPGFLEPEDCFVLCCFHTWHPCGCQSSRQAKRPLHIMPPYLLVCVLFVHP